MYGREKSTNICRINILTIFNNKLTVKETKELTFKINVSQFEITIKIIFISVFFHCVYNFIFNFLNFRLHHYSQCMSWDTLIYANYGRSFIYIW